MHFQHISFNFQAFFSHSHMYTNIHYISSYYTTQTPIKVVPYTPGKI